MSFYSNFMQDCVWFKLYNRQNSLFLLSSLMNKRYLTPLITPPSESTPNTMLPQNSSVRHRKLTNKAPEVSRIKILMRGKLPPTRLKQITSSLINEALSLFHLEKLCRQHRFILCRSN